MGARADGAEIAVLSSPFSAVRQEFRRRFPHQLSGGQQQRVAIAVASLPPAGRSFSMSRRPASTW